MEKQLFDRSGSLKTQYKLAEHFRTKSALQTYNPSKGLPHPILIPPLDKRPRFKSNLRRNSRTLLCGTNPNLHNKKLTIALKPLAATKWALALPRTRSRQRAEPVPSGRHSALRPRPEGSDVENAYGHANAPAAGPRSKSVMRNYGPAPNTVRFPACDNCADPVHRSEVAAARPEKV